jgi:hypothetical protein
MADKAICELGIGILELDGRGELLSKDSEDRIGSTACKLETWEVVGGWGVLLGAFL